MARADGPDLAGGSDEARAGGPAAPVAPRPGPRPRARSSPAAAGRLALAVVLAAALASPAGAQEHEEGSAEKSAGGHGLKQEAIPLQVEDIPDRPDLLLEIGEDYLAPGPLGEGLELPTGAVWRPALWVFGTFRSGAQSFETGAAAGAPSTSESEWANRLDLVANLRLTGTERLVVEYRPFGLGEGLRYDFGDDPAEEGWNTDLREELQTLFFEGDFGELFPDLDEDDSAALDYGFAVGRQRIQFQDGVLIDDNLDAVGITRNSLRPFGTSNLRITGLYAWNQVHRNNVEDGSARLVGLFNRADFPGTTVSLDVVYAFADDATGDGLYAGASAVQRLWVGDRIFNTAFRLAASTPADGASPAVGEGLLLTSEVSWTPHGEYGLWYVNGFWAAGNYSPAARQVGGPLGRVGIVFAAPGLGRFGSALDPTATTAAGGAIGRQFRFADGRRQLVFEVGGRKETERGGGASIAAGVRFQQAVGRRLVLRADGFAVAREPGDPPLAVRAETLLKF